MKTKILNLALILFSLFGYLEWGLGKQMFLYEIEAELFSKLLNDPLSVLHPFVLLPLAGQLVLTYTLFQNPPSKLLTFLGLGGIGVLMLLMLFIGIISSNYKISLSTLPFLVTAIVVIIHYRKNIPGDKEYT